MNSIKRKTTAYFLIFMLIFSMSMSSFAVTSPYLTLGNDSGESTEFFTFSDGKPFLSMEGLNYAKFENGVLQETNAPSLATKISVSQNGGQANWTSLIPVAYVFVKSGEIKGLGTPYLQTNKLAGNAGGNLYEYPANTKLGTIMTPDGKNISHMTFFFEEPEPLGQIIVTKDVTGDMPKTNGLFKFRLTKVGPPESEFATFTITGENSYTLNDVPYGIYTLQEYESPIGYTAKNNPIEIIVSQNVTPYQVTFENSFREETFKIGVEKKLTGEDIPSGKVFSFELVNKSTGLVVKTLQITGAGSEYFEPVPAGTYYVREVSIPSGFKLMTNNNVEVTVDTGIQLSPIVFENSYEPDMYNINVVKNGSGVPFFTDITFTFDLYRDIDGPNDVVVDTIQIIGLGSGTFDPVIAGDYYVMERNPVTDQYYLIDDPQNYNKEVVIVNSDLSEQTVTFKNHHITYLLGVVKSVIGDTPLKAQEFTFNLYNQLAPTVIIDTVKITGNGSETFKPLEAGTYIVKEEVVAGYTLNPPEDKIVKFPAEETTVSAQMEMGLLSAMPSPVLDDVVTFVNTHTRTFDIYVSKEIISEMSGPPSVTSTFTFALFNADAPNTEIDRITVLGENTGHFKPVLAGTYIVREVNIPANYKLVPFETELGESDEIEVDVNSRIPVSEITFVNEYFRLFDIKVNKVLSGGNQNTEFTFRLYEVDNPEYIQELKINGTGTNYFDPVPEGSYYVKELTGPSGYFLRSSNDQSAVVHVESPTAEVSFRNEYVEESTEPTTAPPSTEPTTAPPSTEPTSAPTTEDLTDEDVPEGFNFDLIFDEPEELTEEETPLGSALPQTGQLPSSLFYGFGGLISSIGIYLKKRR